MKPSNNEILIDKMLSDLFQTVNLDRNEYKSRDFRDKLSRTFDNYLYPYKFSEADKAIRTDLYKIIDTKTDSNTKIEVFPNEDLEKILILEVPKKVIKYTASSNPIIKEKRTKKSGPRGPRIPRNNNLRGLPEIASIYSDEIDNEGVSSSHKRSYGHMNQNEDYDSDDSNDNDDNYIPNTYKLPDNFYTLVQQLFDEFWTIEFDNIEVTWAFFAKITIINCKEYNLDTFAEESSSLAVIHERLKSFSYRTVEDFKYDFSQLFQNIIKFYPDTHLAYQKAIELGQLFENKWEIILTKLK